MPNCLYCESSNVREEMIFLIVMVGYTCNSCGEKFAKPGWENWFTLWMNYTKYLLNFWKNYMHNFYFFYDKKWKFIINNNENIH